jgi:antitoxin HicB
MGVDGWRRSEIMADHSSFSVVLEPQEGGGFTVLVPALPEVITEGDTEQEALANAEEAIRAILAYRRDQELAVTPPAPPACHA